MNLSQATPTPSKQPLDGLTILCVEDGKEARNLLSIFLRRQGARIIEAENGERGLALYREYRPDIVISDFRMPGMDGMQMCKAIREAGDECTPIIFLSAHSEVELLQEAICLSATQYIVKPISFDQLKRALGIATEKLGSQRTLSNRLSELQDTVSDLRYQQQRIEHYVTRLVGGNQHQEARVISRSKSAISGDFYCMEATSNSLYVMLGDGMGHGLAAILPALDLPRRFRELAANEFSLPRIADELNQSLYQRGMGENFATMTLLCMDSRQHRLEVINCGNPPVLVYTNEDQEPRQFPSNHVAMGIVRGDDFCPELQVYRCSRSARLYLYTDGLPETLDSGVPGVSMPHCLSVLAQGRYPTLMEDVAGLLEQVPRERRQDDVTLLEVMYKPLPLQGEQPQTRLVPQSRSVLPEAYSAPDHRNLKWLSVLYVEDDLDALEHLTRYLQRRLGAVHAAANMTQGLDLFDRYRPQLVITDMVLPDGDGLRLIQQIRAIDPAVPVILISGMTSWQSRPPLVENLMSLQINQFLVKPLQGDKLLNAISNCVRRTEYLHKLKLSSSVFMTSPLAITITDKDRNFVSVNPAFTRITGYTDAEVLGCNPKILSSGKHDGDFYRNMWNELDKHDRWSGEIWNRHKNGELFLEWINISVIRDENGEICNYASVFADITQRLAAEEKMRYLAHHDCLTNLPNRLLLNDRLNQAILQAQREGSVLAVIYLDIDHFKNINDTLGHAVGDELILSVAQALQSVVREADTVSRLGGDEFAILLPDVGSAKMASRLVAKIFMAASKTYKIAGTEPA